MKRAIVLVGALRGQLKDARIGGQVFACRSLLQSRLADRYAIHGIDSSISSIRSSSRILRIPGAILRVSKFLWFLVVLRNPVAMIFCSHGASVLEKGLMVLLAKGRGAKCLLFPRSGHLMRQTMESHAFAGIVSYIFRSATVVVCQSDTWRDYYHSLAKGRGSFEVIENWIPEADFIEADAPVAQSPGRRVVVGYFNRIEREKGVFDFLEAMSRVVRAHDDVDAVVFGDGAAMDEVRSWIVGQGLERRMEVRGWLPDSEKARVLRSMDICVFTSHFEGFPNSLLEAIVLKIPVVSVRVGSVPDMLVDGESGVLCGIGDVEGIAKGVATLCDLPELRAQMAEAAFARAKSRNTLDSAVAQLERLLQ